MAQTMDGVKWMEEVTEKIHTIGLKIAKVFLPELTSETYAFIPFFYKYTLNHSSIVISK